MTREEAEELLLSSVQYLNKCISSGALIRDATRNLSVVSFNLQYTNTLSPRLTYKGVNPLGGSVLGTNKVEIYCNFLCRKAPDFLCALHDTSTEAIAAVEKALAVMVDRYNEFRNSLIEW